MHTYLVVYEWYKSDDNQGKIHDKLVTYNCHDIISETAWLIQSDQTANQIYKDLLPLFHNRSLFVTEIILEHSAGKIWSDVASWINHRVQSPVLVEFDIRQ